MWDKDSSAEQLLDQLKIMWEFKKNIPISSLQIQASLKNNARFGKAIDDAQCLLYVHKMRQGVRFPALVITNNNMILGGNNRVHAAIQAGRTVIDAYVVINPTDQQKDQFIRLDNNRHGKNLCEDQKIVTCVELFRKYHIPMKQLNDQFFGGSTETYQQIVRYNAAEDVKEKLQSKGVDTKGLSTGTLAALYTVNDNINILKEAGSVAAEYHLNTAQVEDLTKDIRSELTERDRLNLIKEFKKHLHDASQGKKNKPETNFRRELSRFKRIIVTGNDGGAFPCIDKMTDDNEARKELKSDVNEIINALKMLKGRG
jgi:hypothetical protein